MRLLLIIMVWGLSGSVAAAQGRGTRGHEHLQRNQFHLAIEQLTPVVEQDPSDDPSRAALAQALAAVGACEEALEHFEVLTEHAYVDAMALRGEGLCWVRLGLVDRARGVITEATEVDPSKAVLWGDLGYVALRQGDRQLLDVVVDELYASPRGFWIAQNLEASSALEWGESDADTRIEVFLSAASAAGVPAARSQACVLDALRWLDLGEPFLAEQALAEAIRLAPRALRPRVLRAEAVRRQGNPHQAEMILDRAVQSFGETALLHVAVRARLLSDLGRPEQAHEMLAAVATLDDTEVLLSRWYLADEPNRAALAAELAPRLQAHERTLSDLLPLERP